MSKQTQAKAILEYMQSTGGITNAEAFNTLGVARLASRIHDMRCAGIKIKAVPVAMETRWGKTQITRYVLGE